MSAYKTLHASLAVLDLTWGGHITCLLQGSTDGTTWRTVGTFTTIDTVGPPEVLDLSNLDRFIRADYGFGSSGSAVTFSLLGIAREY